MDPEQLCSSKIIVGVIQLDLGADMVTWETMQPSDTKDAGLAFMVSHRTCRRDNSQGGNICVGGRRFTAYELDKLSVIRRRRLLNCL